MLPIQRLLLSLLLAWMMGVATFAQEPSDSPAPSANAKDPTADETADHAQRRKLQADLVKRQAEYDQAVKELSQLQGEVATLRKTHATVSQGKDQEAIKQSAAELASLEARETLTQERVELAIGERNAVQALIVQVEKKIEQDNAAQRAKEEKLAPPEKKTTKEEAAAADKSLSSVIPGVPAAATENKAADPISPRVAEAEAEAQKKQAEATQAREEVQAVEERKATLLANLELERKRLANSYQRHDNQSQTMIKLEEQLFQQLDQGKQFSELTDLSRRRDEARQQLTAISQEIKDQSERVETLQSQLLGLQQEQLIAAREVKERESAAESARRNQWLVTISEYAIVSLPRVAVILIVLFVIYYSSKLLGRRLIGLLSRNQRGTEEEVRNRTQTLASVFDNAVTTALYVIGGLMILDTLRVPVSTLLGGVAVVGLAVAFGAQNLIRDYFYGFMILLEDQYKIKDSVTINNMTGQVERITLRITVLRDFEGKVYFIPNGQVTSVINSTHEWSRAVLDIPISYNEKIERVMGVLLELAEKLAHDPAFKDGILREPELFGVEKFGDSAVVIRLCVVTRPSQKDTVRRELLRRIKARFDELDIAIPFPQQTIHIDRPKAQGESAHPDSASNGASTPSAAIEQA